MCAAIKHDGARRSVVVLPDIEKRPSANVHPQGARKLVLA